MNTQQKNRGSFMLEFLIALGIFSICLIGLATLHTKSIRAITDNQSSMANSFLLDDAVARIMVAGGMPNTGEITQLEANAANLDRTITLAGSGNITITITDDSGNDTTSFTVNPREIVITPP